MNRLLLCLVVAATACVCATALAADRPRQPLDTPRLADLDGDSGAGRAARRSAPARFRSGTSRRPGPGLELRTIESYVRGGDPGCCPTWQRTSHWTFDRARDRYRTYRTKLVRLRGRR